MANIFTNAAIANPMQPATTGSLLMKNEADKKAMEEGAKEAQKAKEAGLENARQKEEANIAKTKAKGRFDYSSEGAISPSTYIQAIYDNPYLDLDDSMKAAMDNEISYMVSHGVPEDEAKATVTLKWQKAKNTKSYHTEFNALKDKEFERLVRKGVNQIDAEEQAKAYAEEKLAKNKEKDAIKLGKLAYKDKIEKLEEESDALNDEINAWEKEHGWFGIFKNDTSTEAMAEHDALMERKAELDNTIKSFKNKPYEGEIEHSEAYWNYRDEVSEKEKEKAYKTWKELESDLRKWEADNQYDEATASEELKAERAKLAERVTASQNVYDNLYKDTTNRSSLKAIIKEANEWFDSIGNRELTNDEVKKYNEYVSKINELSNEQKLPTYWQKYSDDYSKKHGKEKISLEGGNLVGNTHKEVANAKPGDFMKAGNGEIVKLTQEDIDYSKEKVSGPQIEDEKKKVLDQVETQPEEKIDISKITDGVLASKASSYNQIQDHINELEEKLKDKNLSTENRTKIEADIETFKAAREAMVQSLGTTTEDIKSHAEERENYEKFITRSYQKDLITSWIMDSKEINKYIDAAEEKLDIAKKKGDVNSVKHLQNQIDKLNEQKNAAHSEYGMYLMDALSTALMNAGAYAMGSVPSAKSLYSQKIGRNILAETDRWNEYKAKTLERLGEDVDRRWGENSEQKKVYNELIHNAEAAEIARQMGILDKVNGVEAITAMKNVLGKDIKETLSVMSLLGYGSEQMIFTTLSESNINVNDLVATLEQLANEGLDFASRGLQMLSNLSGKFN